MRRSFLVAIPVLMLSIPAWAPSLRADDKTATGTVTAMSSDSVTVKAGDKDLKFMVDGKTVVEARGAGRKAAAAKQAGNTGPKLSEVVKVGEPVEVSYSDAGGMLHASRIRAITSAGAGGGGISNPAKLTSGRVQSIAADSLTVTGSGGKTMTFAVDGSTKVIGKGAGTKAQAAGGKTAITDLVSTGDQVSVSYHDMNGKMHASEVRVVTKAAGTASR